MNIMDENELITISLTLPAKSLRSVYALLGGAASMNVSLSQAATKVPVVDKGPATTVEKVADDAPAAEAGENAGKVDAAGTPFDAARHTGSIVKSGLWRMKAGIARGPGEGEDAIPNITGTSATGEGSKATGTAPTSGADEDDEFAAFAAAANKDTSTANTSVRTWSDADLSKLNNQAAIKLGSPEKVKALVAEFVPAGSVQHSRMIPVDKRDEYAMRLEETAGIEFEG